MSDSITINGNDVVYAPGVMQWCMTCDATTFDKQAQDWSARMFALSGFLPDLTAGQVRAIATGRMSWTVDKEANTITLTPAGDSE
tara:strand:- start:600 stop:854 length:255 start_codon:yes stop_codon:yes gene_type:complete